MTDVGDRLSASLSDRYRIERMLGEGGMATVYLARDLRHDRNVALKVLRPELAAILGGERFLQEIKTTANLQHPHILPLHDSGEADGTVFYVMPYVDGESLRDRLNRERQLPVDDAVRFAREVADALDYAHRQGVVHRDIKPENILLHDGRAQVADFGIALAASRSEGGTRMTETGMSLGTPHYMAPEQAMGEREITPKADVYALGCVLYEMLTGEPPFTGPTAQAIVARVMTEQPRSLTLQRRTIPPHVAAAVAKALEKLPADRFASAAEFSEALGNAAYATTDRRTAGVAPSARGPSIRRAGVLAPWVLLVAAGAAAAWGWLRGSPQVVSRNRIVIWERPVAPGAVSLRLAIAPDGNTIVYADSVGGVTQLWAKERDRVDATPIAGTVGALGPVFSPDGEWIAFVADGRLKRVPRLGGSPITIADSANTLAPAVAWLDDGTVVFSDPSFSLKVVSVDGGAQRQLFSSAETGRGVVSATALPGGSGALFATCPWGCPDSDLRVVDLESGESRILITEVLKAWYVGGRVIFVRRDGGVFSVPFSTRSLAFGAAPVPVLDGVRARGFGADMAMSASGMLIFVPGTAQSAGALSEAVWLTRQGNMVKVDSGWTFLPAGLGGLALSPDGRRLAVAIRTGSNEDIWIKELDRGPLTRLTFEGSNGRPEWTADGRSVMYISTARQGGNADVRIRRADGTGSEETVLDVTRQVWEVLRTRDTTRLVVRLDQPRDIAVFARGDSAPSVLVGAEGIEGVAPALSPDGRWLAYASDESGRYEVYVRPFPDANAGRWQVSRNGGNEPAWTSSGRELLYRDAGGAMISAALLPGSAFTLGGQGVLFQSAGFASSTTHREYDVTPDGRRFVFRRRVGAPSEGSAVPVALVQVENWLTELRAGRRGPQ